MVSQNKREPVDPANEDAVEILVEMVAEMISRRFYKGQIRRKLTALNNGVEVDRHLVQQLIAKAKDLIRLRLGLTKKQLYDDAFAFYESIIRDDLSDNREKMLAQEAILKLAGIGAQYAAPDDPGEHAGLIRTAVQRMRSLTNEGTAE